MSAECRLDGRCCKLGLKYGSPAYLLSQLATPAVPCAAGLAGELALVVPALGTSQALLNGDHAATYFHSMPRLQPGLVPLWLGNSAAPASGWALRRHGDAFERLPGGCYRALGRLDDTMNLGGIKVGCGELC